MKNNNKDNIIRYKDYYIGKVEDGRWVYADKKKHIIPAGDNGMDGWDDSKVWWAENLEDALKNIDEIQALTDKFYQEFLELTKSA